MESFLKETKYCDFNNLKIKELAFDITKNINDDKNKAIALFYYVRDSILYRVGNWNKKASETLLEGKGVCTSKSNLLIALLRSSGIPAGYGVMRVKGKEYFGNIVPLFFRDKIGKESIHIYVYVYLNNRWIKCDPSDDKRFSENTSYFNPQSKLVDWNGENDAILNLNPNHILEDSNVLDNIDDIICKEPKNAKGIILNLGNLYIDFLRWNDKRINNLDELDFLFKKWLKKNHILYYYFYIIGVWFRDKRSNKLC